MRALVDLSGLWHNNVLVDSPEVLGNGLYLSNVWTVFGTFFSSVNVVMKGSHGYISITEWPLMIVSR